jgi:serpin B
MRRGGSVALTFLMASGLGWSLNGRAQGEAAPVPAAETELAARGTAELGCDLFARLRTAKGSFCIGPEALTLLLGGLYAGARENTATQLGRALHVGPEPKAFHVSCGKLQRALTGKLKAGQQPCQVVNLVWLAAPEEYGGEFQGVASRYYGTGLAKLDIQKGAAGARRQIDERLAAATHGRVGTIVSADDLAANTRLVLTSAAWFRAPWAEAFPPADTREEPFQRADGQTVAVPMMRRTAVLPYLDHGSVRVVEVAFSDPAFGLLLVVPEIGEGGVAKSVGVAEMLLGREGLEAWAAGMKETPVELILPRFNVSSKLRLNHALQLLGARDAFAADSADLSGAVGRKGLAVDAVLHAAAVAVAENGVDTPAAAMAPAATPAAAVAAKATVRADRPFLFLIRHRPSGAVLFLGRVNDPGGQ